AEVGLVTQDQLLIERRFDADVDLRSRLPERIQRRNVGAQLRGETKQAIVVANAGGELSIDGDPRPPWPSVRRDHDHRDEVRESSNADAHSQLEYCISIAETIWPVGAGQGI